MEAGHFGRSGRYEALRDLAEQYAFILTSLKVAA
jgi:protease II